MSVASTDKSAEFTGATTQEEKGNQPLDKPVVGDSTKNIEKSKKTGDFDDLSHRQTENME